MIDDLAANTNAGRLRPPSSAATDSTPRSPDASGEIPARSDQNSGRLPRFTARWTMKAPVPNMENGTASMNITLQL